MNLVITMSRRFGTGASIIAKELSERLHIPVYDKDDVEHGMREMPLNLRRMRSASWRNSRVLSLDGVLRSF